jgi:hypothetical protein
MLLMQRAAAILVCISFHVAFAQQREGNLLPEGLPVAKLSPPFIWTQNGQGVWDPPTNNKTRFDFEVNGTNLIGLQYDFHIKITANADIYNFYLKDANGSVPKGNNGQPLQGLDPTTGKLTKPYNQSNGMTLFGAGEDLHQLAIVNGNDHNHEFYMEVESRTDPGSTGYPGGWAVYVVMARSPLFAWRDRITQRYPQIPPRIPIMGATGYGSGANDNSGLVFYGEARRGTFLPPPPPPLRRSNF